MKKRSKNSLADRGPYTALVLFGVLILCANATGQTIVRDPDFVRAIKELRAGKIESSLDQIDAVIARHPSDPQDLVAYLNITDTLIRFGESERALRYATIGRRLGSDSVDAQVMYGWALFSLRKIPAAEKVYRDCLERFPKAAGPRYQLGHVLGHLRKLHESIDFFEQAIGLEPSSSLYKFSLAEAYSHVQRRGDALKLFDEVLKLTEGKQEAGEKFNRQRAFWNRGNLLGIKAIRLERSRDSKERDQAAALHKEAEKSYVQSIEMSPRDADARIEFCKYLIKNKRLEEAIQQANIVIRVAPKNRWGYYQLGVALSRSGRSDESKAAMEKFRELQAVWEKLEFENLLNKITGEAYVRKRGGNGK